MATIPSTVIAPSVLAANFGDLQSEIKSVADAGADWLHIDVMDGTFVPPITFGAEMVRTAARVASLTLDVHLMIVNPEKHIHEFKKAGTHRLTVHQEVCPHLHRVLGSIKDAGMKTGACVNPGTPVETLFDVLPLCDLVLIMSVNPGWGGQSFIPNSIQKIAALKKEIDRQRLATLIQVDGGINQETGKACRDAGASVLVAGTYVFGSNNRKTAIRELRG